MTILVGVLFVIILIAAVCPRVLPGGKKTCKCKYCKSEISINARVCPYCSRNVIPSAQEGKSIVYVLVVMFILIILSLMGVVNLS